MDPTGEIAWAPILFGVGIYVAFDLIFSGGEVEQCVNGLFPGNRCVDTESAFQGCRDAVFGAGLSAFGGWVFGQIKLGPVFGGLLPKVKFPNWLGSFGERGSISGRYLGELVPSNQIKFTQDSISRYFRDGRTVSQLTSQLKSGKKLPGQVKPIRVFEKDGQLYSLDNRRLFAAKEAGKKVNVQKVNPNNPKIRREIKNKFNNPNGDFIGIR